MKKNNKGFMLAELIITSTVVVTAMIALYMSFNRIYSLYKIKNNYYDVDGVYATKEMVNQLISTNFNVFVKDSLETNHYTYIIKNGTCQFETANLNYSMCQAILDLYHVKNMIFSEYNKCVLDKSKCTEDVTLESTSLQITDQTMKDYIDYVIGYYDIEDSDTLFNYIVITETEENENTYYSNLRVR